MRGSATVSNLERGRMEARNEFPRNHPDSVFIGVIGNLWEEGCKEAIREMVKETRAQVECWLQEITPMGFPEIDPNAMRDLAVKMAKSQGFEWILIMDTDIIPEPDTLLRLISNSVSIVAPYYTEERTNEIIGEPKWEAYSGLKPMRWVTTSMTLYRTSVFNCAGINFAASLKEPMLYMDFWNYGHRPYVDTDTVVKLLRPPSYPSDLDFDARWGKLKTNYEMSKCGHGT